MRLPIAAVVLAAALLAPQQASPAGVPMPDGVSVEHGQCPYDPAALGCADVETATVYLSQRSRFARWHEIGHVFDHQVLTDASRAWFTARLRFPPGTEWMPTPGQPEGSPPGEVFADAYAMGALRKSPAGRRGGRGQIIVDWQDAYGYLPSVRQHRQICNGIAVLGLVHDYK